MYIIMFLQDKWDYVKWFLTEEHNLDWWTTVLAGLLAISCLIISGATGIWAELHFPVPRNLQQGTFGLILAALTGTGFAAVVAAKAYDQWRDFLIEEIRGGDPLPY